MKALVIGATGATGKDLVNALLQDRHYMEVVVFVRRPTGLLHNKLREVITNFDHLDAVADHINGDVWFSVLGTTLKTAGSKEKQWNIDYEIPLKFATIAKQNNVSSTVLLSAYGAAVTSNVFYSKMKGKLEESITQLAFRQFIIFRPGLLLRKDTDRFGERLSAGILRFMNGIGIARKFRPMPTSILAEKMAKAPQHFTSGIHIVSLDKIFEM